MNEFKREFDLRPFFLPSFFTQLKNPSLEFTETTLHYRFLLSVPADEPEPIYHSFVLGVLIGLKDRYNVKSNRESGYGRYDVMLIPKNPRDLGIVIEFKKIGLLEKTDLETAARLALKQIKDRKYDLELQEQGIIRILHLGMAFQGKQVAILSHNTNIIS